MGTHLGGDTPFFIEVTDVLQNDNRIIVAVNNTRRRTNVPCENTDWFNYGGIHRDVEILRLPKAFIKDFKINLQPDSQYKKIDASVVINGSESGTAKTHDSRIKRERGNSNKKRQRLRDNRSRAAIVGHGKSEIVRCSSCV
jgi:beta-galactosidase/beta-glucuronidase